MLTEPVIPISLVKRHVGRRTGLSAFCANPGASAPGPHHRWMAGAALAVVAIAVLGMLWCSRTPSPIEYATTQVTRGDIVTTATAGGTVNPVATVGAGNYVSGMTQTVSCDYNTIHMGQLCVQSL